MIASAAIFIFLSACSDRNKAEIMPRKIIKKGEISFQSASISETKVFLQKAIPACHGYISSKHAESYCTNPTEILTVMVPTDRFDTLLATIGRKNKRPGNSPNV